MHDLKKIVNRFHKFFYAFSPFNIGAFVKFFYGLFKLFDNSIVSLKKVINWYLWSYTNAFVQSFASNNNTNK